MKTANCLSINGGGSKGLIALYQIDYLFERMGKNFFLHWDFIGGTSTGSLITALLVKGYSPKQIIEIYERELPKIFKKKILRLLTDKSKYSNDYIISLANNLLGSTKLGDLKQNIVIPTVNTSQNKVKIFKSHDEKDKEYKLSDVVVASSSAPFYFPAYKIGNDYYKDGGLAMNNPSDILLTECRLNDFKVINILSITTGSTENRVTNAEKKGNIRSVPEMLNEILYLQDIKTHGIVSKEYELSTKGYYERCESYIVNSSGSIDDVCKSNILAMKKDGQLSVLQNLNKLNAFYLKSKIDGKG
jgi:patatin-like phospholipase/acyl hydrolase